ncbi:patatin-like phospholipase family protein [Steroidobacter sp. S1-65]|uniref:Patatin-like phospholipase family protein n=1 Tax=Steroidobacter gossypii TaxID=2805490 RepID=A0ABS1X3Z4_9GAMM|nr:patatin-like phospholipase family protein [Steroidobacter gossypii]MBM0107944.1 patatin-like phospholipase family protein [Steroidobacter gossypii]
MSERTPTSAPPVGPPKVGLVLPGGGARAAYQVGVLRALADLLPARAINPFPVVTGTSAGAVNATAIAVHADRFRVAVGNLERVWRNFQVGQVFRADTSSMLRASLHWFLAMMSGGWLLPPPKSLFDNSPLRELIKEQFDFSRIGRSIEDGHLEALAMSTAGYASTRSVSFFEAKSGCAPWRRTRRAGQPVSLSVEHLMASVAVPFLFPPVLLGDEYYGDGAMREANPFSAAIHLGAQRLLVIGTRNETSPNMAVPPLCPTFGQIFGYMLDSLFTDGMYSDLERLTQLNQIVDRVGPVTVNSPDGPVNLRRVDMLVILPSRDLSEIARHHVASLPRSLRVLLRTLGAMNTGGGQLMSYLLFQDTYTRELIALGYQDAMKRADDLMSFLAGYSVASTGATAILRRMDSRKEQRAEAQK